MNATNYEALHQLVEDHLEGDSLQWYQQRSASIQAGNERDLLLGFGLVARKIPKHDLSISSEQRENLPNPLAACHVERWSLPEAARIALLLSWPADSAPEFSALLNRLFAAGEVAELVALYQGLSLLPFPEAHRERAAEGIRTNMQPVFRAVAHYNPYPSQQLSDGMWNQMVLKCLFVGVSLYPVIGLEERNNPDLTEMLCDYAHERWAASRTVSPELWRCVDPVNFEPALKDLERVLRSEEAIERQAAALALSSSQRPEANKLLVNYPELTDQIQNGEISWRSISLQTT